MTDNVFITGAASGALAEALDGMPPWASEQTALRIEAILKRSLGIQTASLQKMVKAATGGLNSDDIRDVNEGLEDLVKRLADQEKEGRKEKARNATKEKNFKDSQLNFKKTTAAQHSFEAAVIAAGLAIKNTFGKNIETYTKLNEAGINLVGELAGASSGFNALQQITTLTGVRYTELAATMAKYATAVNAFTAGKFAKSVGIATRSLAEFGYSSKEAAELLGSYLEVQQGFTDVTKKSAEETAGDISKLGERIAKLSLTTGMARSAIMANLEALGKSTEATVLSGQVGENAAESTLEFISSMKNQNFGKTLLKMMTDQIKPLNETFQSFQKVGLGAFGNEMSRFTQSLRGMDPAQAAQATKDFYELHKEEIKRSQQQLNFYSQIPELAGDASKASEALLGLQQTANSTVKLSEEDLEKLKVTNKARADLTSAWEKLLSSLQAAFAPTPAMLELLTKGLQSLSWVIEKISGIFSDTAKSWIGGTIVVAGFILGLKKAITGLLGLNSALGKGGLSGLFQKGLTTAKGAAPAVGAGARAASSAATVGSQAAGAGGVGNIGKGIADIGKGIGKRVGDLIKNLLTGLAEGLSALGNPKVLLGVLALGGISAALWITGKAVKEFVSIDWETLAKAGVALVGVTLAVAALGAIMSTGAGAVAILAGSVALAAIGGSLLLLGIGVKSLGDGLDTVSKNLVAFSNVEWSSILKASMSLMALASVGAGLAIAAPLLIVGSLGIAALGSALGIASNGISSFAAVKWEDIAEATVSLVALSAVSIGLGVAAPFMIIGAAGLGVLGLALGAAATGIAAFAAVKWEDIAAATASLVALSAVSVGLMIAAPGMLIGAAGLGALGMALSSAANGIAAFAAVKWEDIAAATASLVALSAVAVGLGVVSPLMLIGAAGLGALGMALSSAANGIAAFAAVKWKDIAAATASLVALSAIAAGIAITSPLMLVGAIGLGALGLALGAAASGLAEFSAVKWTDILVATTSLASLSAVAAGLAIAAPFMVLGGVGLAALSGGIFLIGKALTSFDDIGSGTVVSIAGALTALSAASVVVALAAPGMIIGAIGLTLFSGAIWALGSAISSFDDVGIDTVDVMTSSLISLAGTSLLVGLAAPAMIAGAVGLSAFSVGVALIGKSLGSFENIDKNIGDTISSILSSLSKSSFMVALSTPSLILGATGISIFGSSLSSLGSASEKLTDMTKAVSSLQDISNLDTDGFAVVGDGIDYLSNILGSFSGLNILDTIVSSINKLDVEKVTALGGIGSITPNGVVSSDIITGKNNSSITSSALTTPLPSTLGSPSQDSTVTSNDSNQATPKDISLPSGSGTEKTGDANGINSLLSYQTSILEQILMSSESLISVNKDILKYTRVQT